MSAPTVFSPITKIFPQNRPIFLGKGAPGTEITVCQSNTGIGLAKTIVDTNGSWLVRSAVELPVGIYTFTAYTTTTGEYAANTNVYIEANAQPPTPSAAVVPPIDTTTPSVPPVTGGGLPYGSAPVLTSSTTVNSRRPLLTGRAAANAIVHVYQKGGSPDFGTVTADAKGDWSMQLNQDLAVANGQSQLSLIQEDANRQTVSGWTDVTLNVNLNQTTPTQPATGALTLTSPQNNSTINSLRPTLTGKASANATVHVYQKGGVPYFGIATASPSGDWNMPLNQDLVVGANNQTSLSLTQDGGGTWTDIVLTVNTAPTSTALPYGSAPVLTSSTTVNSRRPLLTGKAAANAIIYVYQAGGSVLFGTPQATSNGDWQLQLPQDLNVSASNTSDLSLAEFGAAGNQVSTWTHVTLNVNLNQT
jgi:hypothetical protein